jgi:hypothetical protein
MICMKYSQTQANLKGDGLLRGFLTPCLTDTIAENPFWSCLLSVMIIVVHVIYHALMLFRYGFNYIQLRNQLSVFNPKLHD